MKLSPCCARVQSQFGYAKADLAKAARIASSLNPSPRRTRALDSIPTLKDAVRRAEERIVNHDADHIAHLVAS